MRNDITSKTQQQLMDVLTKIMQKTTSSISCAEIAMVQSIDSEALMGRYKCELINNSNIVINCEICEHVTNVRVGSVVAVIFCDTDFRQNLAKIKSASAVRNITSTDKHSVMYGVIIGKLTTTH